MYRRLFISAFLALTFVAAVIFLNESGRTVETRAAGKSPASKAVKGTWNPGADAAGTAPVQAVTDVSRPTTELPESIAAGPFRDSLMVLDEPARNRALSALQRLEVPVEDHESLRADPEGALYYLCRVPARRVAVAAALASDARTMDADGTLTAAAAVAIASPPIKHSRKGASRVLYLDFNGHVVTGTSWNTRYKVTTYNALPYDTDGDPTKFSDTEQAAIVAIWERVAEDFSPFDVDVTTEQPATFTSTTGRAVITKPLDRDGKKMPGSTSGGLAYIDVFGGSEYVTKFSPAFSYYPNVGSNVAPAEWIASIAESVSHELGHNLGLSHDGLKVSPENPKGVEYYGGHGTGAVSWGTIMGSAYDRSVTQWSKGEYTLANNQEDDLAIIGSHLPKKTDEAGSSTSTAKPLAVSGTKISASAILTASSDVDIFSLSTGAGSISIKADPFKAKAGTPGGNTDLKLELLNSSGTVVASNGSAAATNASISYKAAKGLYFIRVTAAGTGSPSASPPTGYTQYGSVGQYKISGTIIAGPPVITSASTASVSGGASFTYAVAATNSPTKYAASGLPAGLTINTTSGAISGRATVTGTFTVALSATNGNGTGKKTLTLTVKAAKPAITSQSTGLKLVAPGGSTSLTVSAVSASGTRKYQWYRNGKKISGATSSKYSISGAKYTHSGYYLVTITNTVGTTTSTAVFVRVAPTVTKVTAWGRNDESQSKIPSTLTTAIAIASGYNHGLALRRDGTVTGWGSNFNGQRVPPSGLSKVVAVSAGNFFSVALKSDGTVVGWGNNLYGQISVPGSLAGVVAISAGHDHVLALKSNGTVVAWGRNDRKQCTIPSGLKGVIAVSAGGNHSLALKSDGTVVAWGDNTRNESSVPAGLSGVAEISAGLEFSLARKSDGTVVAWGSNDFGQGPLPAGVAAVSGIAAGGYHSVGLKSDGKVAAWGYNDYNEASVPGTLTRAFAVASGYFTSVALRDATPQ